MGMIIVIRQIDPRKLEQIIKEPNTLTSFLEDGNDSAEDGSAFSLYKDWNGVSYLLSDFEIEGSGESLSNVVSNNNDIVGSSAGPGPAQYLTAEDVKKFASALAKVETSQLESDYNPEVMNGTAEVYPQNWDDTSLSRLIKGFNGLVDFYKHAAEKGNALIFYRS